MERKNSKLVELTIRRKQRMMERELKSSEPDFEKMTTEELKDFANKKLLTKFEDMKGVNTDFLRESVKTIYSFEKRMGGNTIDGLSVKFGGLPRGVYAKYDDKTNSIILKKTGSIDGFELSQRQENARFRIKWKTERDYYATETYSGTIWHELGHAVDIDTNQALSRALSNSQRLDELSVEISGYAGTTQLVRVTKRSEAWAENFAAYLDGGKNATKVPAEIREMIDNYFEKQVLVNSRKSGILKMNLQLFAEDLSKQSSQSLSKGIKSLHKEIKKHQDKIANPQAYMNNWEKACEQEKLGTVEAWKNEIKRYQRQVDARIGELKRRGDYNE